MDFNNKNIKKLILSLALSLLFFTLSYFTLKFDNTNKSCSRITEILNNRIKLKEKKAEDFTEGIINNYKKNKDVNYFKDEAFLNLSREDGIAFLIYNNDSLEYWNDNSVELNGTQIRQINQCLHLGNGWYESQKYSQNYYFKGAHENASLSSKVKSQKSKISVLALILIKYSYPYQNEYLENKFNPALTSFQFPVSSFQLSSDIEISGEKGLYNIYSDKGDFLFSIFSSRSSVISYQLSVIRNVCNLIGIVFLISFLFFVFCFLFKKKTVAGIYFIFLLIVLRAVSIYFKIPHSFYSLDIFSPLHYADTVLLPSLGDLLLDSLLILVISVFLFKSNQQSKISSQFSVLSSRFSSMFLLFLLTAGFIYIFKSLITNSDIVFNFTNIFNLSIYSYIGLIIISLLAFSYFLLCLVLINNVLPGLGFKKSDKLITFKNAIFFILIISGAITLLLNKYNDSKEKERRQLLVIKLAEQRDVNAEFLFRTIEDKIKSDETFIDYLETGNWKLETGNWKQPTSNFQLPTSDYEAEAKKYIQKKYFSGFWSKYNVQITICESTDSLLVKPENINTNCSDFFFNMIEQTCKPTLTENLFYRSSESVTNSYIAYLAFNSNQKPINVFIELDSKFIPKDLGYPKLLIDKNLDIENDYSNYSYSKYKDGELIYQFGKYFYRSKLEDIYKQNKEFNFIKKNKYNHLVYNAGNSTIYVISRENDSFVKIISPFSYLIIFISLSFIVLTLFVNSSQLLNVSHWENVKHLSLRSRIQYSIIFIVIFSFICIGSLSVWYINKTNDEKNNDNLSEKTHSILVELENKVSDHDTVPPSMYEYISGILMNLSNEFFTDINLYNENGRLIGTSRPKIYEEGLLSENMNPVACSRMIYDNKTLFIQKENIGKLSFYSSYMPVRNMNNKTIAYLNLPYFAKQNENKNEISTFLTTFINIYTLLVALSVFVVLFISNYITNPLKLIQEKISKIKLGRLNEKIEWSSNDELGKLIKEYNNMIDKLAESAELLAKSERESAWREMAKQVAHEIKNPLTPMKLNIQHLQRLYRESLTYDLRKDYEEKIEKISATLIEQIDILSDIATQFSDFAKMPFAHNEKIDLIKVINNSVELYNNIENIKIHFNSLNKECLVYADHRQLLRVLNNLIKNSLQAIEFMNVGIITIDITENENNYTVKIADNGKGIKEKDKDRIFSPYFTTRTSGTGLGLSLAKSIIESAGGKIWFESAVLNGTIFYISLSKFTNTSK